jgi:hypothetical protein
MTTRAIQFELLADPLIDPTTGDFAAGYTAYFYAAGTSTPKYVWTEKEKTNPYYSYALDAYGKILLYGDGVYKVIVKNLDGTAVLTLDNQKIQANTFSVVQKTSTYTATPDDDVILCSGTFTLALETVANFEHPLYVKNISSGTITVNPYSTQTIDGDLTKTISVQNQVVTLFPDITSNMWRMGYQENNASGIVYDPATGAATTVQARLREYDAFNASFDNILIATDAAYGAKRDGDGAGGGTDDAAALISVLTAAEALGKPCTVFLPTGYYRCDTVLGQYTFNNVTIDLCGSTIDATNVDAVTSAYFLDITGDYSATAISLTGNAASQQKTIACVSTSFTVGDLVKVYAETKWDDSDTDTKIGELNFVASKPNDASLTVTCDLESTYNTADTAKIHEITPVRNITIKNGTIIGPTGNNKLEAIHIAAGVNCNIEHMNIKNCDQTGVRLDDCIFTKVHACHFENFTHTSQAYGVSFRNATQDCSAIGNTFNDVRHSLSTNNSVSSSWGIVRRILFQGNIVTDSSYAIGGSGGDAIDTHAGADNISIIGNIVNASSNKGINVECPTAIIKGNQIKNCQDSGIFVGNTSDQTGNFIISDNLIERVGLDTTSGQYGIAVVTYYADCSNLVLSNNNVSSPSKAIYLSASATPNEFNHVSITGNVLRYSFDSEPGSYDPRTNWVIDAEYILSGSIIGNNIYGDLNGINITTSNRVAINGNSIKIINQDTVADATAKAIYIAGTSTYCTIVGNVAEDATDCTSTKAFMLSNDADYCGIWCNVAEGFDQTIELGSGGTSEPVGAAAGGGTDVIHDGDFNI